jgi:hypothetical protein
MAQALSGGCPRRRAGICGGEVTIVAGSRFVS